MTREWIAPASDLFARTHADSGLEAGIGFDAMTEVLCVHFHDILAGAMLPDYERVAQLRVELARMRCMTSTCVNFVGRGVLHVYYRDFVHGLFLYWCSDGVTVGDVDSAFGFCDLLLVLVDELTFFFARGFNDAGAYVDSPMHEYAVDLCFPAVQHDLDLYLGFHSTMLPFVDEMMRGVTE